MNDPTEYETKFIDLIAGQTYKINEKVKVGISSLIGIQACRVMIDAPREMAIDRINYFGQVEERNNNVNKSK